MKRKMVSVDCLFGELQATPWKKAMAPSIDVCKEALRKIEPLRVFNCKICLHPTMQYVNLLAYIVDLLYAYRGEM